LKIRSILILIAIILLALAVSLIFLNRSNPPHPRIEIQPMFWDLGRVPEGKTYTKSFKICNNGSAILRIKSARPSCSCDSVSLSTNEVAPYGCAILDVVFNTEDRAGKIDAWIYVQSNDPEREFVKIRIFAEVVPK
jgi:hypothetical protein